MEKCPVCGGTEFAVVPQIRIELPVPHSEKGFGRTVSVPFIIVESPWLYCVACGVMLYTPEEQD